MLDRTVAPPFQKTNRFDLLTPHHARLKNGVDLYILAGGEQDVIKVELIFKAGRWYEQSWGAAHFTGNLLLKGTAQKSSYDIARTFDFYGAHVEISPGLDVISVALYTLSKNLKPVLDLLLEVITDSVFPEKELQQAKSIFLQNLKVNREKTSFQASKYFRTHLFGEVHPYGKELDEKEVNLLAQHSLHEHFERCFKDLFIVASGKVESATADLLQDAFSRLAYRKAEAISLHPPKDVPRRHLYEKEGSIQASVRVGRRFIGRNHSDYFDVLLLNHILGGYFGSRLMRNIREDKGLTYGIYSSIHTLIHDNYLVIGADVNKENLSLTFDEITREFRRLRTEPIPPDELQTAKNHFIGSLQAEITTPFSHAEKQKNILIYQLPDDYYTRLINRVDSLSSADLLRVAEAYYREESFYEIAVG